MILRRSPNPWAPEIEWNRLIRHGLLLERSCMLRRSPQNQQRRSPNPAVRAFRGRRFVHEYQSFRAEAQMLRALASCK